MWRLLRLLPLIALLHVPGYSIWLTDAAKQPAAPSCELRKFRRHHPRRCSAGHCERCPNPTCAKANCGVRRPKK